MVFKCTSLWGESGSFGPKGTAWPLSRSCWRILSKKQNPAGLGFIGVKYDLLRGNPEGKHSLGGVDPGFDKTKRILKLTTDAGENVPIQVCYAERQSCSMSKSTKIFGGTKRYQDKLNVDVSAEGNFYEFNKATNPLAWFLVRLMLFTD